MSSKKTPALRALLMCLALAGGAAVRAQDEAVPAVASLDSMQARMQGCVTCHGQRGQGTQNFPRIAGKPAGYLLNQLIAFRDGTRRYSPMNYLLAYLPDAYLREMAESLAKERPPFASPTPVALAPAVLARGQALATSGDASKQIPACVACHGIGLAGMEPGIPGLAGLHSNYIAAQLTRWRSGDRHAAAPDCMQRIASRLTEDDVGAVSAWLASRPAPSNPAPEAVNLVRMPLACGSQR